MKDKTEPSLLVEVPRNYASEDADENCPCWVHSVYDEERKELIKRERQRGIFPLLLMEREGVSPDECLEVYLWSLERARKSVEARYVRKKIEDINLREKTEMALVAKLEASPSNTAVYER